MEHRPHRRSWSRTFLLTTVVVLSVLCVAAGAYRALVRAPALQTGESSAEPAASAAAAVSSAAASAEPEPADVRKPDFYTVLLYGVDDGNGGSDTNILVGFDDAGKAIHCVSIPRDSAVRIGSSVHKINYAYNHGGAEVLAQSVSNLLGVPVDYTVGVKLSGFVRLVDAIGGVDFNVPIDMDYDDPVQDLSIHFQAGMQHLSGKNALKVVRFRHNNDGTGYGSEDLGRIGTQQAFLKTVARQTLTLSNIGKIGEFAKIFDESVDTKLSVGELAWFGQEACSIGTDNIRFSTLPGEWSSRESKYLVDPEQSLTLVNEALNPYTADRTLADLDVPS